MSLGREIHPTVSLGRPRFRYYPGPPTAAIVSLPFLALTLLGYLTFRAKLSPEFYRFTAGCTVLMIVMAAVTFAIWLRFGVTISLRELGAVIVTRGKEHEVRYADVESITVYDKRRYDEAAVVRAMTRTITLATTHGKVVAQYVALPEDALDHVLEVLAQQIAAVPRPRAGKGWSIEHGTLHVRGTSVPLSSISAAGVFERKVRLWKHRDEEHFFSVPLDTKNARVLLALAPHGVASRPAQAVAQPTPSTGGLGRLLFSRRTTVISGIGNTIMFAFLMGFPWLGVQKYLHLSMKFANGMFFGALVLWLFYCVYRATVRYRFYERALTRISLLGTRTLAYANVAEMEWKETAQSLEHAIPLGTTVKAKLVPDDGSAAVSIRLHRFRGIDGDLEQVRQAIAARVAQRLRARLEAGQEIPWTRKAKFTRDGLLLIRKSILIRYDERIGITGRSGILYLYRDRRKPLTELSVNGTNFHPGLALFQMLMRDVNTYVERTA